MLFFPIYDKDNEVIVEKTVFEQWRHQAFVDAWPSWNYWRSSLIHASSYTAR